MSTVIERRLRMMRGGGTPDPLSLLPTFWFKGEIGYDAISGGSLVTTTGGLIARLQDQSGNNNHATQSTDEKKFVYDAVRGLATAQLYTENQRYMVGPAVPVNCRDFSMFFIVEPTSIRMASQFQIIFNVPGVMNFDYDATNRKFLIVGAGGDYADLFPPTSRCLVGVVGFASGFRVYVNGSYVAVSTSTAASGTMGGISNDGSSAFYNHRDVIYFDRTITDTEVQEVILPYARSRGVDDSARNRLLFIGDSITVGSGSTANRGWPRLLGLESVAQHWNGSYGGATIVALASDSAKDDALYLAGKTNVLVVFAGTNDIAGGATGANTYSALASYIAARQLVGFKVVAVTPLPRTSATITGEYAAYRTLILSNSAGADAVADPIGDATLAAGWTAGAGTYTIDGVHPSDAGYARIAAVIGPVISSVL